MAGNPLSGLSKGQKVAVGAGGVVVVYMVYKSYKNAKAASSSSTTGTDPNAGANIDPATGEPYGSAADQAALASQSGAAASGYGGYYGSNYNPAGGYYNPVPTGSAPTTNAAWAQYAEQQLTSIGYDPMTVAAAIGKYLANLPLTSDQATIVQVALAEVGPPPQGSYSITVSDTGTTANPPPSGGGDSTPPPSGGGGDSTPPPAGGGGGGGGSGAHAPAAPGWIAEQWVNKTSTNVHWAPSSGATSYEVRVTYQSREVQSHTTAQRNLTITGLTANHTYGIHVIAKNSAGQSGETSTTVKTTK